MSKHCFPSESSFLGSLSLSTCAGRQQRRKFNNGLITFYAMDRLVNKRKYFSNKTDDFPECTESCCSEQLLLESPGCFPAGSSDLPTPQQRQPLDQLLQQEGVERHGPKSLLFHLTLTCPSLTSSSVSGDPDDTEQEAKSLIRCLAHSRCSSMMVALLFSHVRSLPLVWVGPN